MQAVRTEELLAMASDTARGALSAAELKPILEASSAATRENLQHFLLDSQNNPEMPEATRREIVEAMEDYLSCLARIAETLGTDLLGEAVEKARASVQKVRAAQDAHRAALSAGPTVFPYLNRLLIQYASVREGQENERLLELLEDAPNFLQWLRHELHSRSAPPDEHQRVFHLQQFLEAVMHAVQSGEELPDVVEDLVELTGALAAVLADPPGSQLQEGPTPIVGVNQILQALGSCSGSPEEFHFLFSLVCQCRTSLRTVVPISSPPGLVERLNAILACLDQIEYCLVEGTEFETLVEATGRLEASAVELAQALEIAQASLEEPGDFAQQTVGMPAMLRSVLLPAYALVAGEGDAAVVLGAADHLQDTALRIGQELRRSGQADPRLKALEEAVEMMAEAAETLRSLATQPQQSLLEVATDLCRDAGGQLSAVGLR